MPARLRMSDDEFLALCRAYHGGSPGLSPLALRISRRRNGVSRLHGQVARAMWQPLFGVGAVDEVPITHVTNGAHLPTFLSDPMRRLLDRHLDEGWAADAGDVSRWEAVRGIPNGELWAARCEARSRLVGYLHAKIQADRLQRGERVEYVRTVAEHLASDVLTLGFARRLATYKRLYLLFHDVDRAYRITAGDHPVQVLIAGKGHPNDEDGKGVVQRLFQQRRIEGAIGGRVAFLEDYDLDVARHLVAGCDVWMNLPRRPLEASGTSGMKATFNGVLQLSVLDGWWAEGYNGSNGWAIPGDEDPDPTVVDARDAALFYDLLENEVVPTFYERDENGVPQRWCDRIKEALVTCAPTFTATRMINDYAERIYPAD
jgi:starch phosphorylase